MPSRDITLCGDAEQCLVKCLRKPHLYTPGTFWFANFNDGKPCALGCQWRLAFDGAGYTPKEEEA